MSDFEIIKSEDGSHTLFSTTFQDTYHSRHGAIRESSHIFIQHGLVHRLQQSNRGEVKVLEFGFGTGLNAALTWKYMIENHLQVKLQYTTLEAYPLSPIDMKKLNFVEILNFSSFNKLHELPWAVFHQLSPAFAFQKIKTRFEEFSPAQSYDLIYYDAFSPGRQPELWTKDMLASVTDMMAPGAIFVTYSVKGSVTRALRDLGLKVEKLAGPPGKREIMRAST